MFSIFFFFSKIVPFMR